jgi:hypothetical protein
LTAEPHRLLGTKSIKNERLRRLPPTSPLSQFRLSFSFQLIGYTISMAAEQRKLLEQLMGGMLSFL